jgi:hypothetical protein
MNNTIAYITFGWLTAGGVIHFIIDVISQHLRGKRVPGNETTLFYGLHSSYALSQVLLGAVALLLIQRAPEVVRSVPFLLIVGAAIAAWFAIGFAFIEYWQPKLIVAIFAVLTVAMILTRP